MAVTEIPTFRLPFRIATPTALDAGYLPTRIDGIHPSAHNPALPSWDDLRADGIYYAIHKSTQGIAFVDPFYDGPRATRYRDARSSHAIVGAFHYANSHEIDQPAPALADAPGYYRDQADNLIGTVRRLLPGDLPPTLDFERGHNTNDVPWRGAQWLAPMEAFLDRVEIALGRVPMIYTSPSLWTEFIDSAPGGTAAFTRFGDYPLWVIRVYGPKGDPARYAERLTKEPDLPTPWSNWAIWQYAGSESGEQSTPPEFTHLAAVDSTMDLDVSYGGIHSVRGLADLGRLAPFGDDVRFAAYADENGVIKLLRSAGSWTEENITAIPPVPPGPFAAGDVTACEVGGLQYIAYRSRGDDGHLHEIVHGAPAAVTVDLTHGVPVPASDPVYFVAGSDRALAYWGDDDHQYLLWHRDGQWQHPAMDVTTLAGLPPASGNPAVYVSAGAVHVVARAGADGHLWDAWHDGQNWNRRDLTGDAGAPAATYQPTTYTGADGTARVVYRALHGALHEIDANNHDTDLSLQAGGAPTCAGNPAAFVLDGVPHVVYRQPDGILRELAGDGAGGFTHRYLPCAEAAADPTVSVSVVAGRSTASIYFRGLDGGLHIASIAGDAHSCEPINAEPFAQASEANGGPTVVIDPGHGGSARMGGSSPNNASGPNGLLEKDLTLDLSRRVGAALGGRAQVTLTRSGDTNQSLTDRARIAHDANANVFLSIHMNGFSDPAVDGSEAWVARHANDQSRRLARSVLDGVLSVTHARDRGVREEDLGVLLPDRHAPATAAALVEVAFLTNPDEAHRLESDAYRQSIAQAIADGVAKQLGSNGAAATASALTTTEQQTALDLVSAFRAKTSAGAFTPLRSDVADRATALINDPTLVDQGSLNVCGPAAVHRLWIARDPVAFARYVTSLYDTGSASFGSRVVSPGRDLRNQDYDGRAVPAMRAAGGICPSADWVALSSLRDASNTFFDFEGMPSEDVSAMSTPADVAGWMRSTGVYSLVTDEGNWVATRDVAHAEGLYPGTSTDVVLLINAHILTASAASGLRKSDEFILSAFPNHFVVLESAVTEPTPDEVEFDCWSWGGPLHVRLRKDVFQPNYYGAVIGTIGVPAPAPASGFEARALDAPPTPVLLAADSALVRPDRVIPAANCGVARGPDGSYRERVPEKVVIHVLDGGTYDDDISHWNTGSSCTPPHYVIKSDGEITQMVAEKYMAQHAGPGGNPTMIGIEHDGTDADSANFTETMYVASAALVRDICNRNSIAVDRAHIIGHDEVPLQVLNQEHGDPGGYWDWDYYLALVRWDGVDPATKPLREVVDTAGPAAVTASAAWHEADRDSGRADWRQSRINQGPSYRNAYGVRYMWADGAPDAAANDTIEFMFVAPAAGTWGVSAWWPILADGNPSTTIEIETTSSNPDQQLMTLVVDQRALSPMRGRKTVALGFSPTWYVLPAFDLTENDVVKVRVLRRSGAAGKVIADAFRFLKT